MRRMKLSLIDKYFRGPKNLKPDRIIRWVLICAFQRNDGFKVVITTEIILKNKKLAVEYKCFFYPEATDLLMYLRW